MEIQGFFVLFCLCVFTNKEPLSDTSLSDAHKHVKEIPERLPSYTPANQKLCPSCMLAPCHSQMPLAVCVCWREGRKSDKQIAEEELSDL